ncbi:MAG: TlpA disulfide reductase family protein [Gammaproteobacteria bacterium]|jgi:thiol-disulfide isomerase/thioredoxin
MRRLLSTLLLAVLSLSVAPARAAPGLDLSAYKGKVVYVDFWASWCGPCRHSFPWMNAMQKKYAGQGLVIVGVNVDSEHADAAKFLQRTPADFRIVYDPEGKLAEKYQLMGMPSSFLYGRNGELVGRHVGFTEDSPAEYEREIKTLLGQ